jgi:hypothetical protein
MPVALGLQLQVALQGPMMADLVHPFEHASGVPEIPHLSWEIRERAYARPVGPYKGGNDVPEHGKEV